jgi:alanyl-tRNA synthetase
LASVQRLEAEIKSTRKLHNATQSELLAYQVEDWRRQAETVGPLHVVSLAFQERDNNLLKETASRLTEQADMVALLATRQPRPQFVFARGENVDVNMGTLIRAALAVTGGRGGGRPEFAQGGAPEDTPVEPVLDHARQELASL